MPNKFGKGYGSNNRVTSRTPAPLDEGGVRPSDSRTPNSTPSINRRVTSRTGNQIPNPVEEFGTMMRAKKAPGKNTIPGNPNRVKTAAATRLVNSARDRVGAKIPTTEAIVASKGARAAARRRGK